MALVRACVSASVLSLCRSLTALHCTALHCTALHCTVGLSQSESGSLPLLPLPCCVRAPLRPLSLSLCPMSMTFKEHILVGRVELLVVEVLVVECFPLGLRQ